MELIKNGNKTEQPLEFSKLQGFDVLESLPEEPKLKSYNEEFYSSLSNLKFLSLTAPEEERLLYKFETNKNTAITSTIGQMRTTVDDLKNANKGNAIMLDEIRQNVQNLRVRVDNTEGVSFDDIRPEIDNLRNKLQVFLVNQKGEKFKLIKEIALLQKEKVELYSQLSMCVQRLDKVEREVGRKKNKGESKGNKRGFLVDKSGANTGMTEKEIRTEKL